MKYNQETYEAIRERMLNSMSNDIDKREGSFVSNMVLLFCFAFSKRKSPKLCDKNLQTFCPPCVDKSQEPKKIPWSFHPLFSALSVVDFAISLL